MKAMQVITAIIVIFAPALVLLYDLLAYRLGGREATITAYIQNMTVQWPELPAIAAGLFVWLWMHLFMNSMIAKVHQHLPPLP